MLLDTRAKYSVLRGVVVRKFNRRLENFNSVSIEIAKIRTWQRMQTLSQLPKSKMIAVLLFIILADLFCSDRHVKGIVERCKSNFDKYQSIILNQDTAVNQEYKELRRGNSPSEFPYIFTVDLIPFSVVFPF